MLRGCNLEMTHLARGGTNGHRTAEKKWKLRDGHKPDQKTSPPLVRKGMQSICAAPQGAARAPPGNPSYGRPRCAHTVGAARLQARSGIPEAHGAAQQRKEKATPRNCKHAAMRTTCRLGPAHQQQAKQYHLRSRRKPTAQNSHRPQLPLGLKLYHGRFIPLHTSLSLGASLGEGRDPGTHMSSHEGVKGLTARRSYVGAGKEGRC